MPFFPDSLNSFMDRGGPVMWLIMAAALIMWLLVLERFFYFRLVHKDVVKETLAKWDDRRDHSSRYAHWVKEKLVSEVRQKAGQNVTILKAVVALAPLFGLLGTVYGMITVFDMMSLTGSSDAQAMSSGVSKATIPTMAGMVVSLSGILTTMDLERKVRREVAKLDDQMEVHSEKT